MSAKYKSPSFLLPNELNTSANTANDTGINSLYSMDFDGSSQYINANTTVESNLDFSVSAWINPASYDKAILGTRPTISAGSSNGFTININSSGNLWGRIFTQSTVTQVQTGSAISLNNWSHIAVTYESSSNTLKTYLNGSEVGSVAGSASSVASINDLNIGRASVGSFGYSYFSGKIDEVAIFNRALNTTEIAALYGGTSPNIYPSNLMATDLNPIAYYPLGEQAQNSGYPSATGNEWQFPNGVLQDYVMDFDGTDYIDAGVILSLNNASEFTISTWVKLNDLTNNYRIFGNREFSSPYKGLGVETGSGSNAGKLFFYSMSNNGSYPSVGITMSNEGITANNWFLLTCKYKNSTQEIFINGSSTTVTSGSKTSNVASTTDTTTANFLIGADSIGSSGKLNGELSNFQIFNTGVNVTGSNSIETLYNNGSPLTSMSGFTSLTNWWKLNADSVYTPSAPNYTTALDFVSSESDYIDCGDSDSFSFGDTATDSPFSISAWVNMADATNFITIAKDANSGREYVIRTLSDDKLYFYLLDNINGGYVGRISSGTVTSNQSTWIHTSYTYNGNSSSSGIKIYLNGSQVDNDNYEGGLYTAMSNTSTNLNIGRQERGLNYANGSISNVAIFNTALTQAQVSTLFNFGTPETNISFDPVAWWKLNDQTAITDYSGNGNTGTNNGAVNSPGGVAVVPSWKIPDASGTVNGVSTTLPSTALQQSDLQFDSPYSNYSLDFDGAGDYIDCTDNDMFSFGNGTTDSPFSVSFWAKLNSVSGTQPFLSKDTTNPNREWAISIFSDSSNGVRIFLKNQGGDTQQSIDSSTALTTGVWYHITTTYDGRGGSNAADGLNIYINGSLDTPTNISKGTYTAMSNTTAPVYIGKYSSSEINGKIDETAIWNTALTEAQVLEIYNNGKPGNLDNFSGTAPISWWRLGENAYFNTGTTPGPEFTVPNSIAGAPNGVGSGTVTTMLSADAPGTYANGIGDGLAITDRVGDAPLSVANSQSYNMIPDDKVPYVPGYVGAQISNTYSMAFDGTNYFDIGTGLKSTFDGATAFTISAWFKYDTANPNYSTIIQQEYTVAGDNYLATVRLSNTSTPQISNRNVTLTDTTALNSGQWYHIVSVFDGSSQTLTMFIDGTQVAQNTSAGSSMLTSASGSKCIIGANANNNRFLDGLIDEVAIFDKALTADQIKFDLYEPTALVGGVEKTADIENNTNLPTPVAWYRMGD